MFSNCILCKSANIFPVLRLINQPIVQNVYYHSASQATDVERCDIQIFGCRNCQMLFNAAFDEGSDKKNYTADYKYSPPRTEFFKNYLDELAQTLINTYGIQNTEVAEIGCGRPEFLEIIAEKGNNTCVGIDPAAPSQVADTRITLVQKLFDGSFYGKVPKLVILRQTVEHISDPVSFLKKIKESLPEGAYLYIEVPGTEFSVEHKCLHDFYHEHVGYYTEHSMRYLLEQAGLRPVNLYRSYGNQYWSVVAVAKTSVIPAPLQINITFMNSLTSLTAMRGALEAAAQKISQESDAWALWGGGAKGVTFSNIIGNAPLHNLVAVDANPEKKGVFMGGSGVRIYAPEELSDMKLDTVVIMNALYKDEITAALQKYSQGSARVILYESLFA